jgi:hypothetical protein
VKACYHFHFGKFFFQCVRHTGTRAGKLALVVLRPDKCLVDAVESVGVGVKIVIAQLVVNIQVNEYRANETDGKAEKIDAKEKFLAREVSEE